MARKDTGKPTRKLGKQIDKDFLKKVQEELGLPESWRPRTFPKSIGACVDALYTAREARLKAQREMNAQKAEETALREHLKLAYDDNEIKGARGKIAQCSVSEIEHANILDPMTFFKWVAKTHSFDLLRKQCNDEAARARWAQGVKIPGVNKFVEKKLSLTKVK